MKTKNKKRGRKSLFKEDIISESEAMARFGLTENQIAHVIGINPMTLVQWKKKNPEFEQALKRGETIANMTIQKSLYKKAIGYEYQEVTRERIIAGSHKGRHSNKEGSFTLTEKDWKLCLDIFDHKCAYCGSDEFIQKDHVIPLAKSGEFKRTNIIPACKTCNCSKKDRNINVWYKKQSFFDKKRLEKIELYLKDVGESSISESFRITKIINKHIAPDITSIIFWLKNKSRDEWRDIREHKYDGLKPMPIKDNDINDKLSKKDKKQIDGLLCEAIERQNAGESGAMVSYVQED